MQKFYDCGIDLGTTNSCIAKPTGDNSCIIIENTQDRMQVTPSAIAFDKRGRMIVGQRARNQENCAMCFKRKMGTSDIIEFSGTDVKLTPEELSAEILKSLKRDAESRLSEEMNDVVITVPAAFSSLQNESTKRAAALAGFRNVILLQEPIAASVAYGATPNTKEKYWMVFDYGGGTLDVSIVSTHNGRLSVVNSEGDNYCGGSDIDRLIYDNIIKPRIEQDYNISGNIGLERKMITALESCKIELSSAETSIFEEFDSEDNDGTPIEFEYEITRQELEKLIEPSVDRCIAIAKKALDGAENANGVGIEQISSIILVGGSTFIPLVREKLKDAFDTELSCSLNPMTVVAEGAAIYSATCVAEVEENAVDENKDMPVIKMQYEPITAKETENIVGNIENIGNNRIDKIKIDAVGSDDATGALWTSGWMEFLDKDTGFFDMDIHITPNGINKFVIHICDKTGREIKTTNNSFEIRFNCDALKISAPPATYSVCVLATDGKNNILKPIINKNTPLPAEGTSSFVTTKELRPSSDESININVYEGEIFENPDANHWIGCVHVKSSAIDRTLPIGTSIEINIMQDESRTNHITGYIPDADYEIPEETLRDEGERMDLYRDLDLVKIHMQQADETLNKLSRNDIDVTSYKEQLTEFKNRFDELYACNDSDKIQLYIKDFYELHTMILKEEREFDDKYKKAEESDDIEYWRNNIKKFGSNEDKRRFTELSQAYERESDGANKKYYRDEMSNAHFEAITNSFEFLALLFKNALDSDNVQYKDYQKASHWRDKGNAAIRTHNIGEIRNAVDMLLELKVGSANNSMANKTIADLRI